MRTDRIARPRMVRVSNDPHAFIVACGACGQTLHTLTVAVYADLDGKPFVDYYCESCRAEREAQGV